MCPHQNGDSPTPQAVNKDQMTAIDMTGTTRPNGTANGVSHQQRHNPYAPRACDFLNNVSNFKIIESTLRGMFYFHVPHGRSCFFWDGGGRGGPHLDFCDSQHTFTDHIYFFATRCTLIRGRAICKCFL